MKYHVTINLSVDYNDSALQVRNTLEKLLRSNSGYMPVKIRSTEVHPIEDDVIKFKGGIYSINAWLMLLSTDLLKEIFECRSELMRRCYSHATSLSQAIHYSFDWQNSKSGSDFWAKFCIEEAPKIEDEYFEKIDAHDTSYFISRLSEPFKTDALNFLAKKPRHDKPCTDMKMAIILINWMETPNVDFQKWMQLHDFYSNIENEITHVATAD